MSTTKVTCPSCGTRYEVPAEYLGKSLHCGNCNADFTPTAPQSATPLTDQNKKEEEIEQELRYLPRSGASILLNVIAALAFCAGAGGAFLCFGVLGYLGIVGAVVFASAGLLVAGLFWGLSEMIHFLARIDYNVKEVRKEL